ncbi:non-homologous end-joining DNA ligase [Longimicrobium sp.]|uniref:non-homologous end-joining DNA ligase n=1 Tax=Longimicrobium sp. TaxID=2029185 RepID=UPI002E301946|nr:non-homologous end-joining DNA ligase [Longimicrobium sp.]HEX6037927.1 non-homologous end-joining DNA ligase [Longimicrobium sp.]
MITRIGPMLAQPTDTVPEGPEWLHEQKYDGVRIEGHVGSASVALFTANGHNKARQFPEVADAFRALHGLVGHDLVLDGEIVAAASDGFTGFQLLQRRLPLEDPFRIRLLSRSIPAAFVGFDVLAVAARSIRDRPLRERRQVLNTLLSEPPPGLRLALQDTAGVKMVARARAEDWEGIVSKRADSPYLPGQRGPAWRKLKLALRQEFVVGGFTTSTGERRAFGAVVVGYHDRGRLVYAGRVGTGFSEDELARMAARLRAIQRSACPFAEEPKLDEPATWVDPRIVIDVRFNHWTETGRIRWPRFLAVREDKRPEDVVRET